MRRDKSTSDAAAAKSIGSPPSAHDSATTSRRNVWKRTNSVCNRQD